MKNFDHMVEVLSDLRERSGVIAIKSEFEAEGTRLDEAMLLLQVLKASRLPLAMKIGGAEALFDLTVALNLGVNRVVAPMVESAYALSKFLHICGRFVPRDHRPEVAIAINVETVTSVQALDEMTRVDRASDLTGVVIGRNDLAGSLGRGRGFVDSEDMYSMVHDVCAKARQAGWDTTVGGG